MAKKAKQKSSFVAHLAVARGVQAEPSLRVETHTAAGTCQQRPLDIHGGVRGEGLNTPAANTRQHPPTKPKRVEGYKCWVLRVVCVCVVCVRCVCCWGVAGVLLSR